MADSDWAARVLPRRYRRLVLAQQSSSETEGENGQDKTGISLGILVQFRLNQG